jgi:acyl-CoA dehydrogenase
MIDFTIPPELADVQRRVQEFVREVVLPGEVKVDDDTFERVVEELRAKAREAGLWNPHLGPQWGGLGLGALGMALVSQECGVSALASLALNCMAPDEGNMHLLEHAATPEQKERYLRPLANAEVRSCFAMTEKDVASSDPTNLRTRAVRDGDRWVVNGRKWFITGAGGAAFSILVAQTDPEAGRNGYTLFLVDSDMPGWNVGREIPTMGPETRGGGHYEVEITDLSLADAQVLGALGQGFALSQVRLGPARLAHAMRWIGVAQRCLDLASQRALEREVFGRRLAEHQAIQWMLADSAIELYASRLMVLHAAWLIETGRDYRQEVSISKVYISEALNRIVDRALQIYGSLGYSTDTPIEAFYRAARAARLYDGASEVHRMVIARNVLKASMTQGTTKGATGGIA